MARVLVAAMLGALEIYWKNTRTSDTEANASAGPQIFV